MKLLVVGVGSIGRIHAKNASKYAEIGIVDHDISKAKKVALECDCTSYSDDLDKSLQDGYHGVIVSVPHKYHIPVATKAIESGADVLIEKPISHDYEDARSFIKYAQSINRNVFVVCNMRFHPAIQAMHKNLSEIGKPLFARAHYGNYLPDMRPRVDYRKLYVADKEEGGVVLDGIHELDYLSWFFGSITRVLADASHISTLEIEADDYAAILARHKTSVRSEVHLDYLRRVKRRGCEINGTDGLLHWISEGKSPEQCVVRLYTPDIGWSTLMNDPDLDGFLSLKNMMKEFTIALQGKNHILQTGNEAVRVLAATLATRNGDNSNARQIS